MDAKLSTELLSQLKTQKEIIDNLVKLVITSTNTKDLKTVMTEVHTKTKKSHKAVITEMKMPHIEKKIQDIICLCNFNNKLDRLRRKLEFEVDIGGPNKMIINVTKDQLKEWVNLLRENPEIEISLNEIEILRYE